MEEYLWGKYKAVFFRRSGCTRTYQMIQGVEGVEGIESEESKLNDVPIERPSDISRPIFASSS